MNNKNQENSLSIYIHIPFCLYKCNYCDFYSESFYHIKDRVKNELDKKKLNSETIKKIRQVIEGIKFEIKVYSNYFKNSVIKSIYFGGGTPSIIQSYYIKEIIDCIKQYYKINKDVEITIETNPEDLFITKIESYKSIGINRISIGIQTFENKDLKFLERRGSREKNLNAINLAKQYFKNISCDLIAGLPFSDIYENLRILKSFDIPHLSIYMLTLYKDVRLYKLVKNNIETIEDKTVEDYLKVIKWIEKNGYFHYEISNFAKNPDFISRHNLRYWERKHYLGLGPSASGFFDNIRYTNYYIPHYLKMIENLKKINFESINITRTNLKNINLKNSNLKNTDLKNSKIKNANVKSLLLKNKHLLLNYEELTDKEIEEEYIMLSLRLNKGLNMYEYENKFHKKFIESRKEIINKLKDMGYIFIDKGFLKIYPEKFIFFNYIVSQLI